jgi:iron complex transport system substrate-binding protein
MLSIMMIIFAAFAPDELVAEETITIVDMRGRQVVFPKNPQKVATINDGLIEGVMTHLGVINKVAAVSSRSLKEHFHFVFETAAGESFTYNGFNTMRYLHPWLEDLPSFRAIDGGGINFEILAKVEPDLVIMRVGDCTMGLNNENVVKTINMIEALGFPLMVLQAPGCYDRADLSTLKAEIILIGEAFGRRGQAEDLAAWLTEFEDMVKTRNADVPEKTSMLYLGLNPDLRKKGAAGSVLGINTPESYIIENLVNARNACRSRGYNLPMSIEQIYALDPDVIVLPAANGYHPARELYEASYFADLSELRAIKNRRVYALPWSPYNCSRRLEYPLEIVVMAKAAYPDRYQDFSVADFALEFFQKLYGVDEETARGLRRTIMLDWLVDAGF